MDDVKNKDLDQQRIFQPSGKEPRGKLNCYDWLADVPGEKNVFDMVEVQFKNTRKGYYRNSMNLPLEIGDMVAVEASPGHDIGRVSLTGKLVALQIKKANLRPDTEIRRVFRKAKASDLEKFEAAKAREYDTMIRSRQIAKDLRLNMKIGDVEYQGDGNKAIFYYIADERVDFRQLIKVLADAFHVRIEMKQIGARQEAGRIGGIGPCGRPLCCSSWMTNFVSVAKSAARYQDISLNPQKLAGQCAKLKCCLNYEVDAYVESVKQLPSKEIRLETKDNTYFYFKADIFSRMLTYTTEKNVPANMVTISAKRAFEVIALNKNGVKPDNLDGKGEDEKVRGEFGDILGQDSVTRFDKTKKKKRKRGSGNNGDGGNKDNNRQRGGGNQADGGNRQRQGGEGRHAATTATAADNEDRRMETNSRHPLRNPRKSRLAAALCLVAISLLAATCTPGGAFDSDFKTIDAEGWTKSSPLVFLQPDSIRGVDAYDIAVSVRHDNYYPYRNLLLIVDYVAGDKIVEHDTVNVELCDEYGDWGGSGLGKLFQKQMLIKERVPVGRYDKIVVWHNMRVSKVTNVTDVGLTYIKSK